MRGIIFRSVLGLVPVVMWGYHDGPPPKRTGAPVDGGINCTACHRTFAPANSDPRGSLRIDVANYVPGVKQTIKVTVIHPEAARWGFEITARLTSDETKTAGEFSSNSVVRVICDDNSPRGALAPCQPGQLQFAEHLDAPRTDPGAGFSFSVDWTPPATDAGDVIFYAAGNAANGSDGNTGDRVYTTARRISPPCGLTQKPTIRAAVNGASFQAPWNSGAMMTVFGSNFGAAGKTRGVTEADVVAQKYPQSLACMAVTVNGVNAPIAYVQQDQINLQAPQLAGIANASVVVIANPGKANELRSDPLTLTTGQTFAPAFFTFNGKSIAATTGDGLKLLADPAVVAGGVPAKSGDIVVLYATGLGATNPAAAPGDVASAAATLATTLTVTVGGVTVPARDVLYAGLSPQSICGLIQINVRLPADLPNGDVPVALSIGGAQSAGGTTIPVKN
jgi:uncharacterized protein (TIGR03437 family)